MVRCECLAANRFVLVEQMMMLLNMPHDIGAESLMTLVTQAGHVSWYAVDSFCNHPFRHNAATRHWQEDLHDKNAKWSRQPIRPIEALLLLCFTVSSSSRPENQTSDRFTGVATRVCHSRLARRLLRSR